jgi:hypothetical protein
MRIISKQGVSTDIEILDEGNDRIRGVTRIEFDPITAGAEIVTATLGFEFVEMDLSFAPFVSMETLEQLAAQHGCILIPEPEVVA